MSSLSRQAARSNDTTAPPSERSQTSAVEASDFAPDDAIGDFCGLRSISFDEYAVRSPEDGARQGTNDFRVRMDLSAIRGRDQGISFQRHRKTGLL